MSRNILSCFYFGQTKGPLVLIKAIQWIIWITHWLPQWLSGQRIHLFAWDIGDAGSVPLLGRSPEGGNHNPLQCSCLENSMNREDWQATVHGIEKSLTRLNVRVHMYLEERLSLSVGIMTCHISSVYASCLQISNNSVK